MRAFNEHNPVFVFLYYVCVIFITMFSMHPVILALSLLFSVLTYCLYARGSVRAHIFSLILFLVLALINPLFVHNGRTVLFYFNSRPFTAEAALYGLCAAAMVVAALYRLRSFSADMTGDRVMYVFGRISPKLSLIISMTLRFVELFKRRYHSIQDSQKALGLYKDGNLIDAVRGRLRVLSILITWSLENGVITAASMDSRGYGSRRRTSYKIFRFTVYDLILILLTLALTALAAAGAAVSPVSYYPELSAGLAHPLGLTGCAAYALLCALPIILNTKEAVKWRFLRSAI